MSVGRISASQLRNGCEAFAAREHRDAMYRVSVLLVKQTWGNPAEVADALGVILLTWNQGFYRYGPPDFDRIEEAVREMQGEIASLRSTDLMHLSDDKISRTVPLFEGLLEATRIYTVKRREVRRSPVSAAKALHALAPRTFPIWDDSIRRATGYGGSSRTSAQQYIGFMRSCRDSLLGLSATSSLDDLETELSKLSHFPKTILKFLDEYLYSLHTKHWI